MNDIDQIKKNAGLNEAYDYSQQARIEKVQSQDFTDSEKLIFMWVKQGVINVREFSELNRANHEAM